jgi:hypothetical protein
MLITVKIKISKIIICTAHQYYTICELNKNGMGVECCIYGAEGRFIQVLVWKPEKKTALKV